MDAVHKLPFLLLVRHLVDIELHYITGDVGENLMLLERLCVDPSVSLWSASCKIVLSKNHDMTYQTQMLDAVSSFTK